MKRLLLALLVCLMGASCGPSRRIPDFGELYNALAQREDPDRNPVIVIPGLLGSKLVQRGSATIAWGAFGSGQVNPATPAGARLVALPMATGSELAQLRDDVEAVGALDRVVYYFFGYPVELNAYYNILGVLGAGGYRDQELVEAGAVDYGNRHFTCFQFDYDWRRDLVESARKLDAFIRDKKKYVEEEIRKRFGIDKHDVRFDIVAHSMGGLVARYYLRYGTAELPPDGSLPELTWAGSRYVGKLVMIGTPNAGSAEAFQSLIKGARPALLFPFYPAAILGTMPAMYQLLPRSRRQPVLDASGQPIEDLLDPGLWARNHWGLADPDQDRWLRMLLPNSPTAEDRRRIALDHQKKALIRARQFFRAMDVAATPPPTTRIILVAGDSEETPRTLQIDQKHRIRVVASGPGDGTVLRSSALMDERPPDERMSQLVSPIGWSQVLFLFSDHLGLTEDPAFTDNLLYVLLESPETVTH